MAYQFKNNLNAGINLDVDLLRMPQNAAVFIKNLTNNININAGTPAQSGQDSYVFTPIEGNAPISVSLPSGVNYCVGFYSSEQTNEGYFCVYNSNNDHQIYVINGDNGDITLVYHGCESAAAATAAVTARYEQERVTLDALMEAAKPDAALAAEVEAAAAAVEATKRSLAQSGRELRLLLEATASLRAASDATVRDQAAEAAQRTVRLLGGGHGRGLAAYRENASPASVRPRRGRCVPRRSRPHCPADGQSGRRRRCGRRSGG